jgi:hypothetical protein
MKMSPEPTQGSIIGGDYGGDDIPTERPKPPRFT